MYYSEEVIQEVRQRNDIVDVVSQYVHLKKMGSTYFGLCPFHNEKSPSFSVTPSKQMYYCFGCHAGGSVFTFVQQYENFTFVEAVKYLANRANVELPEIEYTEEMKRAQNKKQQLMEINKEAAKYFFYRLRTEPGKIGKKYFEDRALSEETMNKFGLGYSLQYSDDLVKYLKGKGYSTKLIYESGLANYHEKYGMSDKFINRVMFPIQDINHRVIGFGGRVLGAEKPKYLNSPESPIFDKSRNLYGLNYARTSRKPQLILCEGYMDVIAMHQAGFNQAVASLGTAFTEGQANILKRYTDQVLLAYDSDDAGVNAAIRASGILRNAGLVGKVINMKPYKDPDEFIKNLGAEEFQKRIDEAENLFLFEVRMLARKYNIDDPAEKTKFHLAIAQMLCRFEEELERDNYRDAICRIYTINPDAMQKMIREQARDLKAKEERIQYNQEVKKNISQKTDAEEPGKESQRYLLTWLVEEPQLYEKIEKYISAKDFTDPLYQEIAQKVFEGIKSGSFQPVNIISYYESVQDDADSDRAQKVAEVFHARFEGLDTPEKREIAFRDTLLAVKENSYRHMMGLAGKDMNALKEAVEGKKALEQLSKMRFQV